VLHKCTIINALRLQIEIYRKIESQEDMEEEDFANIIMDRGYTESFLGAIENDYHSVNNQWISMAQKLRQMG
jgi:hypothetical protein